VLSFIQIKPVVMPCTDALRNSCKVDAPANNCIIDSKTTLCLRTLLPKFDPAFLSC